MRRTLAFVLGFMAVLVMAEVGVRQLAPDLPSSKNWPSLDTEVKNLQIQSLEDEGEEIDVVLLGSSVTEAAVDPAVWMEDGVGAYNAAIPYGTLLALEEWAIGFVVPRLRPQVVVVGTSLWYPNHAEGEDPFRNALAGILARSQSNVEWPWDHSELWTRRGQLKYLPASLAWKRSTKVPVWTEYGHQSGYARGAIDAIEVGNRGVRGDPSDNLAALSRLLTEMDRQGITSVVMIEPAECPVAFAICDTEGLEEFVGLIEATASDSGATLIDAREFETLPEMFADRAHFNRLGTVAFSDYLLGELRAIGVLVGP